MRLLIRMEYKIDYSEAGFRLIKYLAEGLVIAFIAIILPLGYFVVSILFSIDFYKKII